MVTLIRRAVVILCALCWASALVAGEGRPNVLFVMADDLNCDLGCYGHGVVKSPNIDRLAARGTRFERAYCQYPVCNPSRSSLLTGLRPPRTGIVDNMTPLGERLPDATTLPGWFRRQGYRTIKLGKIFHTGERFEHPRSWDSDEREGGAAKDPPNEQIMRRQGGPGDGLVLGVSDDQAWDGQLARRGALIFEQESQQGQPLFLAVGFRRPHRPYIAPAKYFDLYPVDAVPALLEPVEHLARIPRIALTYGPGKPALAGRLRAEVTASYWASISYLDAQVGILLDALDRLGAWDNTVVVFLSDHGYHLGEHGGLWHKMTLFEESARVPLIVAAPGKKPGVATGLVELVDLFPTLAELCGLPAPSRNSSAKRGKAPPFEIGWRSVGLSGSFSDCESSRESLSESTVGQANRGTQCLGRVVWRRNDATYRVVRNRAAADN